MEKMQNRGGNGNNGKSGREREGGIKCGSHAAAYNKWRKTRRGICPSGVDLTADSARYNTISKIRTF